MKHSLKLRHWRRYKDIGLLVNSSRDIIYAGKGEGFAEAAGAKAWAYRDEMEKFL